jgi:hypothetical protein
VVVLNHPVSRDRASGIGVLTVRSLVLNRQLPQVNIPSDHLAGGFFQILPETTVNLTIEFNPNASLVFPAGEAVLLVPVFTVDSQAPCESVARFVQ